MNTENIVNRLKTHINDSVHGQAQLNENPRLRQTKQNEAIGKGIAGHETMKVGTIQPPLKKLLGSKKHLRLYSQQINV